MKLCAWESWVCVGEGVGRGGGVPLSSVGVDFLAGLVQNLVLSITTVAQWPINKELWFTSKVPSLVS